MRKSLLSILFLSLSLALAAQQAAISVLGDRVPLYESAEYDATVLAYLNWDSEVQGAWKNGWYAVTTADGQEGFLSKWDAMENTVLHDPVQAKRIAPSAETLFRMMKFFKNQGKTARSEEYALRIINDFRDEEYPTKDGCFKISHLTYIYMVSKQETGVVYDPYLAAFSAQVIDKVKLPAVVAMAHYHLARYESLNGNQTKSLDLLFHVITNYPEEASRNECYVENTDTWFYRPQRSKQLFLAIAMIQPERDLASIRTRLDALIAETPTDNTKVMAQELRDNLGTMPYQRDQSIWY
ncbi:MAG: SH3 domain-containing protein [Bacteroidia bacterium]